MKELLLVRHGEAEHLVGHGDQRLTGGWTDSSLTERGRQQAHDTVKYLVSLIQPPRVSLYASDLMRCRETAEIIGRSISIQPSFTGELRELNNGAAANRTRKEAKALEIPVSEPVLDWTPYPGAESWSGMHDRVMKFMESIESDGDEQTVIVSHGGPIVAIIHWWLELSKEYFSKVSFDIEPCSVTRLTINRFGEKTISKLNDTGHLRYNAANNH